MRAVFGLARSVIPLRGLLVCWLVLSLSRCDSARSPTFVAGVPDASGDSTASPQDSLEGDSIPEPGTDSTAGPGVDSLAPPSPDSLDLLPVHYAGIPFGLFRIPPTLYGKEFNGGSRALGPAQLLAHLVAARRAGARVFFRFVGSEMYYHNSDRSFSLTKWKQRLDRYRDMDLSSYIADGTIAGHYILDEPHDPSNWGGKTVPLATIDEMAKYSKAIWPTLPTVIRAYPSFLKGFHYQYLDAAWAQYSERFGPIDEFIRNNVSDAKSAGLALVVGLNMIDGGDKKSGIAGHTKGKYAMNGSQVRSWGSTLLSDPYVCAFISWRYHQKYLSRSDVTAALAELSQKAKDRPPRSCRRP